MSFRLIELYCGKTKVLLSPLFFALITLFLLADREGIAVSVLLFSLLHETAHFAAALILNVNVKQIKISLAGICVGIHAPDGKRKIAVFSAGFFLNYALSVLFLALGKMDFMLINFVLGFFTSLPLPSSDGGEIIRELFEEKQSKTIFMISAAAVLVIIIMLYAVSGNIFFVVPATYIIALLIKP